MEGVLATIGGLVLFFMFCAAREVIAPLLIPVLSYNMWLNYSNTSEKKATSLHALLYLTAQDLTTDPMNLVFQTALGVVQIPQIRMWQLFL